MSSASLLYKKKMDRLKHSIKVQCVCDHDCDCNYRYGESILEEENADDIYGEFHQNWEEFIGQVVYMHQLKLLKHEEEFVPSRWRMKECDNQIKIDDAM